MVLDPDLEAWLRLSLLDGIGPQSLRKLLIAHGSPRDILSASVRDLSQIVSAKLASAIRDGGASNEQLEPVVQWLTGPANHVITFADAEYPRALLEIADPPPLLYAKGRLELLNRRGFAIVGSRNATAQGVNNAEAFAETLSDAGLTIISGLALGIDAAAHRGGLTGAASTVAVVGTGLDVVYPARNRELAHRIAAKGLIISEFALGTPGIAANFPRRNRLICGLSRGVLVVEAAVSSGSLITARLAAEQGRDVFAIPGSIHSPLAKGCHALIKQGAKLVESAQDVLEELGELSSRLPQDSAVDDAAEEHPLLEHLGFDPVDIDTLQQRSGLDAAAINSGLTDLELTGLIESLPGGRWQRIR
jgi:DNA processing protein